MNRLVALSSLVLLGLCGVPLDAEGQDRDVVFVHGFNSGPETWELAAARLSSRSSIVSHRPKVSWWSSLEAQADEIQRSHGHLPQSTIVIGHSLGGIASRQWTRLHPVGGVITLGSPHRGAPIANHIGEWLGFNYDLFWAMGNAVHWLTRLTYDQWWWVLGAVEGLLGWAGHIADLSVRHLVLEMGLQFGTPFVQQIYVGSPYLDDLNGSNVSREASQIPYRVGIVNTMPQYWRGGPFRLRDPDYGGEYSVITNVVAASLTYVGSRIYAEADPLDTSAQNLAFRLWDVAFWLFNHDEFWCRATSDNRPIWHGHCFENDGFVPTWSQFYPTGINLESWGGPVHSRETQHFDDYLYGVLTNIMHVPPRGSAPPPPPPAPPPSGSSDTLTGDQSLRPGQSITSSDGRFRLVYQTDGNLVLYRDHGVALWWSATEGTSPGQAILQLDGNFVVYDSYGTPLWHSGTAGYPGAYVVMQGDGNLVVYARPGVPLWASGTSGS